jgi:hypothetical protein
VFTWSCVRGLGCPKRRRRPFSKSTEIGEETPSLPKAKWTTQQTGIALAYLRLITQRRLRPCGVIFLFACTMLLSTIGNTCLTFSPYIPLYLIMQTSHPAGHRAEETGRSSDIFHLSHGGSLASLPLTRNVSMARGVIGGILSGIRSRRRSR